MTLLRKAIACHVVVLDCQTGLSVHIDSLDRFALALSACRTVRSSQPKGLNKSLLSLYTRCWNSSSSTDYYR